MNSMQDFIQIQKYMQPHRELMLSPDVHEIPEPSVKEQRRAQREMVREKARKEEKRRRIIADKSRRANKGK